MQDRSAEEPWDRSRQTEAKEIVVDLSGDPTAQRAWIIRALKEKLKNEKEARSASQVHRPCYWKD